jgi:hypothetical protein
LTKPKSRAPADDVNDDRMPVDGSYAARLGGPDTVSVKWSTECTRDSVKWLTADSPRVVVDESSIEAVPPSALAKHANFMLIATPDKRPCVQKRQLNLAWNRSLCHGAPADFGVHFQADLACFSCCIVLIDEEEDSQC